MEMSSYSKEVGPIHHDIITIKREIIFRSKEEKFEEALHMKYTRGRARLTPKLLILSKIDRNFLKNRIGISGNKDNLKLRFMSMNIKDISSCTEIIKRSKIIISHLVLSCYRKAKHLKAKYLTH